MFLRVSYLEIPKDNDTRTVAQVSNVARGPLVFISILIGFVFSKKKSFTDVSLGLFSILNDSCFKIGVPECDLHAIYS